MEGEEVKIYKITEWSRLEGTSRGDLVQTLAQGGCPGPCGLVISPRMETLPPLWETSATAQSPSQ